MLFRRKAVPFNAFSMWRDGVTTEILDYPKNFDIREGKATPDGVHFVAWEEFYLKSLKEFIGVPTAGAKVENDVLVYPVNEKTGKDLRLRFSKDTFRNFNYDGALKHCKENGMRLPTVRELFDFCAAGVTEPNYGPKFDGSYKYPKSARCYGSRYISASLLSEYRGTAWSFDGYLGTADHTARFGNQVSKVRCVTNP